MIDRIIYHATRTYSSEDSLDRYDSKVNNIKIILDAIDKAVTESKQEIIIIREKHEK